MSGEFEASPWHEVLNWGRCVKVASADDIDDVHRLVAAPGDDRRAVFFEWLTKAQRHMLIDAIEATGLDLRPFDDSDRAASTVRVSGTERTLMAAALPYVLMMRVRRRTSQMYEVTRDQHGRSTRTQ